MNSYTEVVIRKSYKELLSKIITSLFIRGLLLIIPIFWSSTINYVSESNYHKSYYLIVVILLLSIFYYIFQYLNQVTWFKLYNKLYLEYTNITTRNNIENIKKISLAEYTNIINNDIDIICNFIGNSVVRIIQIIEFIIIYLYFLYYTRPGDSCKGLTNLPQCDRLYIALRYIAARCKRRRRHGRAHPKSVCTHDGNGILHSVVSAITEPRVRRCADGGASDGRRDKARARHEVRKSCQNGKGRTDPFCPRRRKTKAL